SSSIGYLHWLGTDCITLPLSVVCSDRSTTVGTGQNRVTMKPLMLAMLLALLSGCSVPERSSSLSEPGRDTSKPKTLILGLAGEPTNLAMALSQQNRSIGASNEIGLAVHQWLAVYDDKGTVRPMIAAELPSQE